MKDVISMRDFSKAEILFILDTADDVKRAIHNPEYDKETFQKKYGTSVKELLHNQLICTLFLEKSTRTNYSFRTAALKAGAQVQGINNPDDTSLGKGESWADTIAMFAGYGYNALVMRTTTEGIPRWSQEFLAKNNQHTKSQYQQLNQAYHFHTPLVLNGGDGTNQHPTQCFLDLMTIREIAHANKKEIDNLDITLLNDLRYGRTNASLMSIAHFFNWTLHLAYPPRFGPRQDRLDDLMQHQVKIIDHGSDFKSAMMSSLIAYHSRPQKERVGKGEDLLSIAQLGRINKEMYDLLEKQGPQYAPYLLHPKPVDSETFEEISHDLMFHPKNFTNFQAANGLYMRIALLTIGLDKIILPHQNNEKNNQSMSITSLPHNNGHKELNNPRSGYIEHEGIVLDHIPAGLGRRLSGILGLEHSKVPKVISDYLPTQKHDAQKDLIKIHCPYEFTNEQYEAMALIAPNITISIVNSGKVTKKIRPTLGNSIENRIQCYNNACVTNVRKEHVTPRHSLSMYNDTTIIRCDYCETHDSIDKIYQQNRFIYIGEER